MFRTIQNQQVKLANGLYVPIEEIIPGDILQGQSGDNTVIQVKRTTRHAPVYQLNSDVECTSDQLFLLDSGLWAALDPKEAEKTNPKIAGVAHLNESSWLVQEDRDVALDRIEQAPRDAIYSCTELELDGDHTFFMNGYLVHNKGSGSSGPSTVTNVSQPPAYLEPYLTDLAGQAQTAYRAVPTGGFSGSLVAKPTDAQLASIAGQKTQATNLEGFGNPTLAIGADQANKVSSGYYTAPMRDQWNPVNLATQPAVDAYLDPVKRQLQEDILPKLTSQAVAQGAYGGSRYATEQAKQVNDNFTREAANIAAQLGYGEAVRGQDQAFQSYQTNKQLAPELFRTEEAAALALPEIQNAGAQQNLLSSQILGQAGAQEQLNNQDILDEAYNQYLLATQAPFVGLDQYASVINGAPGGGTSTATSSGVPKSATAGFLSGALGGGLGAYGLGQLGFSALGGPIGIGAGAILGGLMGAF